MDSVMIAGVRVDVIDKHNLEREISRRIQDGRKEYISYVNVHAINIAQYDKEFQAILNGSGIVYCDGEGVRLGARLLGVRLPSRIVLTYWIWDICKMCEEEGLSIYFLGGKPSSVATAVSNIQRRFPRITIAGFHHGYFEKTGEENEAVIKEIASARPHILFVCFGMPLQEHWVKNNFGDLRANLILFGGATIEYAAGVKSVAPSWMSSHGMEWLYRLLQEPRRLWRRYLAGNPLFLLRVLKQRFISGAER